MTGLIFLIIGSLYFLLSVWFVSLAVKAARKRGASGRKWGLIVGLMMYLLVFWDQVPTFLVHKYYCNKYADFNVYQNLDEWKGENSASVELLDVKLEPDSTSINGKLKYWTTQRFYTIVERGEEIFHAITLEKKTFVDGVTEKVLAQSVNYWRGKSGGVISMGGSFEDVRRYIALGWGDRQCGYKDSYPTSLMDKFRYTFQLMGENKND